MDEVFTTDGKIVTCQVCGKKVGCSMKSQLESLTYPIPPDIDIKYFHDFTYFGTYSAYFSYINMYIFHTLILHKNPVPNNI